MTINFKEIPKGNRGGGQQDTFELFARDFFEDLGYKIERPPDRGPDGKKDIILSEIRKGIGGESKIFWLVSCKHNAHSGDAVSDTDEPDITDRVANHKCNGFIGFYSTLPSSSLSNKLHSFKDKIQSQIFDNKKIEKIIIDTNRFNLFSRYFPTSFVKYKEIRGEEKSESFNIGSNKNYSTTLTEEKILEIAKTAIILIDIEKIKEEYFNSQKHWNEEILYKLYKYTNHSNEKIAIGVFQFLVDLGYQTRAGMPSRIVGSIHSLILTFFPYYDESKNSEAVMACCQMCIHIGFSLTYDAFIRLDNFLVAEYGLSILKFIYRYSKENKLTALIEEIFLSYERIENALNRPDRKDLETAKELVKIFKDDLDEWDLGFPALPDYLYKLTEKNDD